MNHPPGPLPRKVIAVCVLLLVLSAETVAKQGNPASTPMVASRQVQKTAATVAAGDEQTTNVPYFWQSDGMSSVLTLNNNMPSKMEVSLTIFSAKGKPLVYCVVNSNLYYSARV
jgi:hypothetical protein